MIVVLRGAVEIEEAGGATRKMLAADATSVSARPAFALSAAAAAALGANEVDAIPSTR